MSDYTTCQEGVTRRQAFQPCDKPAVAMRLDPEDKKPYPVCRRHCRENMVPLAEVKAQAWHEGERRGRDNERALMMCQAQLRPSSSAVLITNPYRHGETE